MSTPVLIPPKKEKERLLVDTEPALDLKFPPYWPDQGWRKLWGGSQDDDAPDLSALNGHLKQGDLDPAQYDSAILSTDTEVFKALCSYIERNIVLKSYKAPSREATRMGWARATVANKDGKYNQKWIDSAQVRLMEGKKGGPKPPRSGAVEVVKIRILRNVTLWKGYTDMKQEILDGIDPGSALRTVRFVTGTPSRQLPMIDPQAGEVLLFHGTSKETMKKIAGTGFDPTFCVNKGTDASPNYGAVGRGVYFSDSFSKVMTYTTCYHCGAFKCDCSHKNREGADVASKRVTFLARVLLGSPKNKRALGQMGQDKIRKDDLDSLPDNRHSVYAKGAKFGDLKFVSGSNEFVIKKKYQMYPEFVVYWRHS
jgi:Poly(ADP-ribose) polymerase catalytic domain